MDMASLLLYLSPSAPPPPLPRLLNEDGAASPNHDERNFRPGLVHEVGHHGTTDSVGRLYI